MEEAARTTAPEQPVEAVTMALAAITTATAAEPALPGVRTGQTSRTESIAEPSAQAHPVLHEHHVHHRGTGAPVQGPEVEDSVNKHQPRNTNYEY